ncbi:hypothetical protein DL766_003348 [Monosporascus sp. MC13-8B]|uniref:3-beta hydroxysteroid dehydrogenase/isomerase domain-containing protein n=1 Tax=Monosporascus cannonballus TaxID=155416 RepID=A0ABY0HEY1_9PEZI|nr:hypothetical protein DL762_002384 [Monosporascus cannonballus]RYO99212.1 hypothetical protein DL763_001702 [Monosporascus cannonballus]RYP33599.1 hypothetical protein DL766_003348 [Monosporascus sp. MC13-8B]
MYISLVIIVFLVIFFLYLYHINYAMSGTPEEALKVSPDRWTEKEMRKTYRRISDHPIDFTKHLPRKQERRYTVVGGSGLVGGSIVLQLLARGQPPESIRIIDFRQPYRDDMLTGPVTKVSFIHADISSAHSTQVAFSEPWSPSVSTLPLTVFHTAAVIRPAERSKLIYNRCSAVNVTGTINVLAAARKAGADIFIATASSFIALRPVDFWIAPWTRWPVRFFQSFDESDFDQPQRPHEDYFGNYAVSKAEAERLVCSANQENFRTGCIRPANGVYGTKHDQFIGASLNEKTIFTWMENFIQNFVSAQNISLAHLLFESALLTVPFASSPAGRTFNISDPNPPICFRDIYNLLSTLAVTPFHITYLPPVLMLLLSYFIEAYCLLIAQFPVLQAVFKEPSGRLQLLQPAVFTAATHIVVSDAAARLPVVQGGLGYQGVCTTLEGMCQQVWEWNREHE